MLVNKKFTLLWFVVPRSAYKTSPPLPFCHYENCVHFLSSRVPLEGVCDVRRQNFQLYLYWDEMRARGHLQKIDTRAKGEICYGENSRITNIRNTRVNFSHDRLSLVFNQLKDNDSFDFHSLFPSGQILSLFFHFFFFGSHIWLLAVYFPAAHK